MDEIILSNEGKGFLCNSRNFIYNLKINQPCKLLYCISNPDYC